MWPAGKILGVKIIAGTKPSTQHISTTSLIGGCVTSALFPIVASCLVPQYEHKPFVLSLPLGDPLNPQKQKDIILFGIFKNMRKKKGKS